ncbi:MAG: Cobalt-zinc-cadmium resistance protein CzcC [Planctomycetes bacterium]|nr:Cobalt-zinc-cadmium resistance protein CzcC [Planctomycetota bacterium]
MVIAGRWMACVAVTVVTGGCVTYEPAPLDRDAELAALRATTLTGLVVEHARPGEQAAAPKRAFDAADGLDEDEVVSVALTLNPGLKAKRLEIGEAEALLVGAGLWPNPKFGVSWEAGLGSAPGHAVDADLLFELLQPGRRSARIDAATARTEEVAASIVAEEWRVVREARLQRLEVLAAEQLVALLGEEVALRERTFDFARRAREAGEGTQIDVSAAELEVAEVRRELRRAETDLESARRTLNAVLGLPPGYVVRLSESEKPLTVTVFEDVSDDELERRLLAGRFELRALEAAYRRSEHELRLAIAGQFPKLGVGVAFDREGEGDKFLGPAAEIEIPLFDRNQGEIAEKLNARDRARAAYVAELHRVRVEAYDGRALLRRARLELEAQDREVLPLVRSNQDLVERAFRARELDVFARVVAQERALRARQAYLETLVRYQRAVVEVETATALPLGRPAVPAAPKEK